MKPTLIAAIPLLLGACGSAGTTEPAATSLPPDGGTPRPEGAGVAALAPILAPLRAEGRVPALAAAVFDGAGLRAIGAVGTRQQGTDAPVTQHDRWHLGSDTKAMTATLVAMLVDEGKLRWDAPLATLLPDVPLHQGHARTTLEDLLGHRAGLPGDVPPAIWDELWKPGDPAAQRRWFAREMLARAPVFPPGTRAAYANAGYMIAGAVLERLTGRSWEALMKERLFGPLDMTSCGFGPPATPGRTDHPWGHAVSGDLITPVAPGPEADNPPALGPAGTVHCALADWGKFLRLHLRGARGDGGPLVTAAALRHLQTPASDGPFALGWVVTTRPWAGGTALTHAGSNTMFYANAWMAPAKDRIFVAVTNRGDGLAARVTDAAIAALLEDHLP